MATAAFLTSREGKGRHGIPSSILLDLFCLIGPGRRNATTAKSKTSTGLPIEVTLCAARPPVLSHLSISCAACPEPEGLSLSPRVVSTDADLLLLRVPISPLSRYNGMFSDYFVYTVHSQFPKLKLLPKSTPDYFGDQEIAILSCGDRTGTYAVASLQPLGMGSFTLHLYRSRRNGKPGSWTSQQVDVEEPLRDDVRQTISMQMIRFHRTTKVITLGGAKGTLGWVDLRRGILLCDVLEKSPKLRDVPLPCFASNANRIVSLDRCPYYLRDIVVNQSKDTIKYVEMKLVPDDWRATTWSMPISATSGGNGWCFRCSAGSADIHIPAHVTMHYKLLHKLMSGSDNKEGKGAEEILSLGCLHMAYPTLSITDDDVVYLLAQGAGTRAMMTVFTLDLRTQTVRGVAKLSKRHLAFFRYFLDSGISKHLGTTGASESLGQTEMQAANTCDQESTSQSLGKIEMQANTCDQESTSQSLGQTEVQVANTCDESLLT